MKPAFIVRLGYDSLKERKKIVDFIIRKTANVLGGNRTAN